MVSEDSWQQERVCSVEQELAKLLLVSCLLVFSWPKQVIWQSPEAKARTIHLLTDYQLSSIDPHFSILSWNEKEKLCWLILFKGQTGACFIHSFIPCPSSVNLSCIRCCVVSSVELDVDLFLSLSHYGGGNTQTAAWGPTV